MPQAVEDRDEKSGSSRDLSQAASGASLPAHTPDGLYEITRDGRVFSRTNWRGYGRREITQDLNDDGYLSVRILVAGKRTRKTVHGLVAAYHLPPRPSPLHEVRHLDGNRLNPHADNLAWGTRQDNADDRGRHGRTSRGPKHAAALIAGKQLARERRATEATHA